MEIAIKRLNETLDVRARMVDEILCLHIPRLNDKQWDRLEYRLNNLGYHKLVSRYNKAIDENNKYYATR